MDLEASILEMFCVDGLLHREVPEYVERYQQIEMAIAIASALEQKSNALIEAGTGTGKTFAYLVPILLQKKMRLSLPVQKRCKTSFIIKIYRPY